MSRLLDRTGNGIVSNGHDGVLTMLLDVYGTGSPSLALELDTDGQVVATQYLELAHQDQDGDDFSDLADGELPLPDPIDMAQARRAPRCECPEPFGHHGFCAVCGRTLREAPAGIADPA